MCDGGIAQPASSDALWAEMQSCITKQVNWLSFSHLMVLPFSPDGRTYPCDLLRNGDFPSARQPSGSAAIPDSPAIPCQHGGRRRPSGNQPLPEPVRHFAPRCADPHVRSRRPQPPTGGAICPKRKLLSPNTYRPVQSTSMVSARKLRSAPGPPGSARRQPEGS